jgi:hypothetical protein
VSSIFRIVPGIVYAAGRTQKRLSLLLLLELASGINLQSIVYKSDPAVTDPINQDLSKGRNKDLEKWK